MNNSLKFVLIALLGGSLAACGGSSSSGGNSSSSAQGNSSSAPASSSSSSASTVPVEENLSWMIPAAPTPSDHTSIPEGDRVFYVSTEGSNSDPGTEEQPYASLQYAVDTSQPGDVIVLRGGIYDLDELIRINANRSGTASKPIKVFAYPGEEPVLDFASQGIASNNHGIRLYASYWHLYGLTIRNAGHNGIRVDGSYNRLERLVTHNNYDSGILLRGSSGSPASHNLVMNSDSYGNYNSAVYTTRLGNNADGMAAKGIGTVGPGNHFFGNRTWGNSDDGFDFFEVEERIVLQKNWTFDNGNADNFGNPTGFDGNGNGFKLGGNYRAGNHVVIGNMAFNNFGVTNNAKGFDHNNNTGGLTLLHNVAFNNGRNYDFPNAPVSSSAEHRFYNNISVQGSHNIPTLRTINSHNSWNFGAGIVPTNMFLSVDTELARTTPRQDDGSLPEIDLLRPTESSALKGLGANIGLSNNLAPDLGVYGYILR